MKSSSQHSFAVAPQVDIPRSSFKRDMTYKTTFNAGDLNCVYLDEVLPGDTFNLKLTSFLRLLSPLKYPILDNLYCDFQFFFVPIRLVYDEYEEFFGSSAGKAGNYAYDDSHLMPGITAPAGGFTAGSLADQFGLPINVAGIRVNALPFRAYNRIINDWYRPSSYGLPLQLEKTDSTDDNITDYPLCKRMKRADYFTSALIAPQRGPGVNISLGGTAPVVGNGGDIIFGADGITGHETAIQWNQSLGVSGATITEIQAMNLKNMRLSTDPNKSGMVADLSLSTPISINDFRQAFQLQRLLERDMRGGVLYRDQLLSQFGVKSPDARLQRSEYLGGGSVPIQIHTVANTNGATGSTQASLAAFAVGGDNSVGFVKSFVEHGYIFCLASCRADLTYQSGIPKMFDRFARFDFYYPVFSHLGEQAIKNKEIFAQGTTVDDGVFGYQERYAEYRYGVSKITGQLRSQFATPLDSWHLAQKFNNLPTLNTTFLYEDVPMNRVKAVVSGPDFLYDSLISVNCVRPMPLFGVPGMVDHF